GDCAEVRRLVRGPRRKSRSARGRMVAEAPGGAGIPVDGAGAEVVPLERVRAADHAAAARLARQAGAGGGGLAEPRGELDEVGCREVDAAPVGLEVRRLPRP